MTESDRLENCIVAAEDRGKQARAELKRQRELVVNMLRELAHYVRVELQWRRATSPVEWV